MFSSPISLKAIALAIAIIVIAGAAVVLARPKPIENAVLGDDWQCSRTAFLIVSCAHQASDRSAPAAETTGKVALRAPRA